jgi:hypothetical protein
VAVWLKPSPFQELRGACSCSMGERLVSQHRCPTSGGRCSQVPGTRDGRQPLHSSPSPYA